MISNSPSGFSDLIHLLVDIRGYALPVVAANAMNDASAEILGVILSIVEAGEVTQHQPSAYQ
ncbi:MAG TPA: hypothetical protein VGJ12_01195 [Gemmatimonadaceae bacterium]